MLVEEFLKKFENDINFKNDILKELKNKKSIHSEEEIIIHKNQIEKIYNLICLNELYETLEEYKLLEENWDGYNAEKPNKEIINKAKLFLSLLIEKINIIPKAMISSTGTIGFYFNLNKNYIEIEIEENNYSYFVKRENESYFGKDDISLKEIDKELLEEINKLR